MEKYCLDRRSLGPNFHFSVGNWVQERHIKLAFEKHKSNVLMNSHTIDFIFAFTLEKPRWCNNFVITDFGRKFKCMQPDDFKVQMQ